MESELRERLEALAERNAEPLPQVTGALSTHLNWDEKKERYLELLAEGFTHLQAAEQLGETGTFFRKFRSPKSAYFDRDFLLRYEEVTAPEGEHREALLQRLRKAAIEEALRGNARLLEKWLMILDPEWAPLRPQNFQGSINIENFVQLLPGVPTPILLQLRQALEENKALPIIDAA